MGEDGSEKKGQFLLRSALSFSCPLPSSSSLLVFFFIRKEKWERTESSGHARGTFSHHLIHPPFHCSLHLSLSLSLPLPSRLLLHVPFSASLRLYVRFDIVACPIPPPPFPASRPSPSITQKEEGRFTRKRTRE